MRVSKLIMNVMFIVAVLSTAPLFFARAYANDETGVIEQLGVASGQEAEAGNMPVFEAKDAAGSEAPEDRKYRLGVGDSIRIIVYGEEGLSGLYTIGGDGAVSMPLIGEVRLEGLNLREAERIIQAKLEDGYLVDPSVSIEVSKYRPFYILGEVRVPGSYDYVSNMSVLNAVALAGGFTYRARRKYVQILKTESAQDGSSGSYRQHPVEAKLEPGDIILVEERFF